MKLRLCATTRALILPLGWGNPSQWFETNVDEKLLPCRFPISFWCRLNAMALQNVRYSCACDAMREIRQIGWPHQIPAWRTTFLSPNATRDKTRRLNIATYIKDKSRRRREVPYRRNNKTAESVAGGGKWEGFDTTSGAEKNTPGTRTRHVGRVPVQFRFAVGAVSRKGSDDLARPVHHVINVLSLHVKIGTTQCKHRLSWAGFSALKSGCTIAG